MLNKRLLTKDWLLNRHSELHSMKDNFDNLQTNAYKFLD